MLHKRSLGEWIFSGVNTCFMILLCFVTLYPFLYVLFASLSDPTEMARFRGMLFYPKGFNLEAYKAVMDNPMILTGYRNTIFMSLAVQPSTYS